MDFPDSRQDKNRWGCDCWHDIKPQFHKLQHKDQNTFRWYKQDSKHILHSKYTRVDIGVVFQSIQVCNDKPDEDQSPRRLNMGHKDLGSSFRVVAWFQVLGLLFEKNKEIIIRIYEQRIW